VQIKGYYESMQKTLDHDAFIRRRVVRALIAKGWTVEQAEAEVGRRRR